MMCECGSGRHNPLHVKTLTFVMKKTYAILGRFLLNQIFFLFFFFLLSLFAPLNGIQQLEDTSDTQLSVFFYLPFLCLTGTIFLCDTALPSWRFWLGTLALTTGSLRPKIGGICSRHFHSSHLKPIQTTSIIRTRTLSNLFAKRIVITFCKRELHV